MSKYTAIVVFSHKGEFIPALNQTMHFNTAKGAKTAFAKLLRSMQSTLFYNYGKGATIDISARCIGADCDLINYKYITI